MRRPHEFALPVRSRECKNAVPASPLTLSSLNIGWRPQLFIFKRYISHENENRFEFSSSPKRDYFFNRALQLFDCEGDIDDIISLIDKAVRCVQWLFRLKVCLSGFVF